VLALGCLWMALSILSIKTLARRSMQWRIAFFKT
jgi:hypothetical protein